jgi:hypothetical protein
MATEQEERQALAARLEELKAEGFTLPAWVSVERLIDQFMDWFVQPSQLGLGSCEGEVGRRLGVQLVSYGDCFPDTVSAIDMGQSLGIRRATDGITENTTEVLDLVGSFFQAVDPSDWGKWLRGCYVA